MAAVKLGEARTAGEAADWLKRKERGAVMADRALLDVFARLPAAEAVETEQRAA